MLYPVLNVVIIAMIGYICKVLIPKTASFIEAKIGLANYTKLKNGAEDIWNIIEENCRLGNLENSKIAEFEKLITAKFPLITIAEIEFVRQAIAGEINKDKPVIVKAIETPVEVVKVAPIVSYVNENGVVLVPLAPVVAPTV
jgi:hypothetical protein